MNEENNFENSQNSSEQQESSENISSQQEISQNDGAEQEAEVVEEAQQSEPEQTEEILSSEKTAFEDTSAADAEAKKRKRTVIGVIAAAVVVVAAAVLFIMFKNTIFNPYIKDYVDVNGVTIGETADMSGMEYSDFLEYYDLPKDMPKSTPQQAALYNMPAGKYAESILGWDFDSLKEQLCWGDDITEETTIGDAFDKTTIGNYVGEDRFEEFKSTFGLDDSITVDTLWGEVRNIVDTKRKEELEAEAAGVTEEPTAEATESAEAEGSAEPEATDAAAQATEAAE